MASRINRKVIGIIYNVNPKWMGGVIYILNAIKSLNWLPDEKQPIIKIYYRNELKRFIDEIEYPYLESYEWVFPNIRKGYVKSWLLGKNEFIDDIINREHHDALFPLQDFPVSEKKYNNTKLISWYADLQHKYYPHFFSKAKLLEREARIKYILKNGKHLVLSSNAVLSDFRKFYKIKQTDLCVYHFASVIDSFNFGNWDLLRKKVKLPEEYFMVSNQFHRHKNHQAVIEALAILKKRKVKPFIAFTGKMPNKNGSDYINKFYNLIDKNKLWDQVTFLDVISRHEQLTLMRYAQAVIQPSLFEGWSTVIEDAISLQTPVMASNLDVNKEQLGVWAPYFDPHNYDELADLIQSMQSRENFECEIYEPYNTRIRRSADTLLSIFG